MLQTIDHLKKSILISLMGVLGHVNGASASEEAITPRQQKIIPIAAFAAAGDLPELNLAIRNGLDAELSIAEINEVLVQLYAYAGFPRSLNGIHTLMSVVDERKAQGIEDKPGKAPSALPEDETSLELGARIQAELLGAPATGDYIEFSPAIDQFLKAHLFGDIFGRDVLSYQDREVATLAFLAAMEGVGPQLQAHFRIAQNTGLTKENFVQLIEVLDADVNATSADRARDTLATVLAAEYSSAGIRVTEGDAKSAVEGPADRFTGDVLLEHRFGVNPPSDVAGVTVTFQPGAYTAWHTHDYGQTLVVTEGNGFVQELGKPARPMKDGDVVWIPPHVKHWHGASPEASVKHVAIIENPNGDTTKWLELVSAEQYQDATSGK